MKSDSPSEINPQDSSSEANEQVVNQINEQGDNILTEENGNATTNPIEVDIAVLADLSQQIETLKAQLEDRSVQYMRIAADFENYRKRTAKEKEEIPNGFLTIFSPAIVIPGVDMIKLFPNFHQT